jgi:anti-sigma B factor antagonist
MGGTLPRAVRAGGTGLEELVLFDLNVSERDECAVLAVTGELDVATAPQLRQEAVRLTTMGQSRIVIDLSGVDFLDSTGLGVIVGVLKRVRTHGGDLAVAGAEDHVRKVFDITRISDVVSMYDTADDACAAFGASE